MNTCESNILFSCPLQFCSAHTLQEVYIDLFGKFLNLHTLGLFFCLFLFFLLLELKQLVQYIVRIIDVFCKLSKLFFVSCCFDFILNVQEIQNMYCVAIELQKHKWKFGRTRNAVETRATRECFLGFFEFSQTFTSVSVYNSIETQRTCFLFPLENMTARKRKTTKTYKTLIVKM